jgi:dTDP-4-amino-4,6-dideoxygalactose transaminase
LSDLLNENSERSQAPAPEDGDRHLPVAYPLLPKAESLLPYLQLLDETRVYSNFGVLAQRLGDRLAAAMRVEPGCVALTASGTAALMAAILALTGGGVGIGGGSRKRYAVVPSFTFAASALAIELCGFTPYFVDIDPGDWQMSPAAVRSLPDQEQIALVMPVAPFGRRVTQAQWAAYREATGVPVIIDAAASFSCLEPDPADCVGDIPIALSLHATKGFGIGEGGALICRDQALVERVAWTTNFGFAGSRESAMASMNGKLSEYQAAVGLAALDQWPQKRLMLTEVASRYVAAFAAVGLTERLVTYPTVDAGYCLYVCENPEHAAAVGAALAADDIAHRFWYGGGVHTHAHFAQARRGGLAVSEDLTGRLVGLPMYPDLSRDGIERVARAVASARR